MQYLDCIDSHGGEASRMDFLVLARNNTANLNRMLEKLVSKWKWVEELEYEGKKRYRKTPRGDRMQKSLKEHGDFEELIEELSKNKLYTDTSSKGNEQFD